MAARTIINVLLRDIPELQKSNVFMKQPIEVEKKIQILVANGSKHLQIISDFDQTLTRQWNENGKKPLTSFGLLHECPSVPESYKISASQLYQKYRPIELDESLERSEKAKLMCKWWQEEHNILKGFRLPQSEFEETAKHSGTTLRDGALDMLKKLNEVDVPVLIFSAGLGDSIMAVLKCNNILYPNVKVISNFLSYTTDDIIDGIRGESIHILNKNEQAIVGTEYYDLIRERGNVILMGDTVGDAGMADGVPHCNVVLRIGFLYEKVQESLPSFMDAFDIVLVDDQTMDVTQAILKLIFQ